MNPDKRVENSRAINQSRLCVGGKKRKGKEGKRHSPAESDIASRHLLLAIYAGRERENGGARAEVGDDIPDSRQRRIIIIRQSDR